MRRIAEPNPDGFDDALGFNLYRVALLFRRELMQALAEYELTPEQWQVMQSLWSTDEDLNQSDVGQLTLREKHTVSRILSRLERDGWIRKEPDPTDGRAHIIVPTEKANALREEVRSTLFGHFEGIYEVLDEEEEEELMRLLKKLRRHLSDRPMIEEGASED